MHLIMKGQLSNKGYRLYKKKKKKNLQMCNTTFKTKISSTSFYKKTLTCPKKDTELSEKKKQQKKTETCPKIPIFYIFSSCVYFVDWPNDIQQI